MKKVLFVCVHNSGRSQMAEAFFNHLAKGRAMATSAGTKPSLLLNPVVVEAMLEDGIETRRQGPKSLTPEMLEGADRVITMGCGVAETCPAGFISIEDWDLDDPEGKSIEEVRRIRDGVKAKVEELVGEFQ